MIIHMFIIYISIAAATRSTKDGGSRGGPGAYPTYGAAGRFAAHTVHPGTEDLVLGGFDPRSMGDFPVI